MKRPQLAPFVVLCLAACGGTAKEPFMADPEPEGATCVIDGSARFLPLASGAQWTVRTTKLKTGLTEDKKQVVGALENIGGSKVGLMGYRVTTTKDNGDVISWQEDTGTSVRRHREDDRAGMTQSDELFIDHKTRLDEQPDRMAEGTTWNETFTVESTDLSTMEMATTDKEYRWAVVRMGEMVTVPAGSFCTAQVTRTKIRDGIAGKTKQYWFARGVGKVKERSTNGREELIDYTVP